MQLPASKIRKKVDMEKFHELFSSGMIIPQLADYFDITETHGYQLVRDARAIDPEKWPKRSANFRKKELVVDEPKSKVPILASYPPLELPTGPANSKSVTRQMTDEERIRYGVPMKGAKDFFGEDCKRPFSFNNFRQPLSESNQ